MLSMPISSSKLALRKTSKLLKCLAKAAAVDSPTSGIPNELIKTSKVGLVAASMLEIGYQLIFHQNLQGF